MQKKEFQKSFSFRQLKDKKLQKILSDYILKKINQEKEIIIEISCDCYSASLNFYVIKVLEYFKNILKSSSSYQIKIFTQEGKINVVITLCSCNSCKNQRNFPSYCVRSRFL